MQYNTCQCSILYSWFSALACSSLPSLPRGMKQLTVDMVEGRATACDKIGCLRLGGAGWVDEPTTLQERRKRGDAIETFKTINGFNKVNKHLWFQIADETARSTRNTASVSDVRETKKERLASYK